MRTQRDLLKILFLVFTLSVIFAVFFLTPALRPASLLTCLTVLMLSPLVHMLEKKKLSRTISILIVFAGVGVILTAGTIYGTQVLAGQWQVILDLMPQLGDQLIDKMATLQSKLQTQLSIQINFGFTDWMKRFSHETQLWLITHLPDILGQLASAFFLVPFFSFFVLRDGKKTINQWLTLIPTRHHAVTTAVVKKISLALSEFLRAKTIEALLVGFMTFTGLTVIGAPYAGILAILAGITNIIPYLGPVLGAAPALAIFGFSDSLQTHFWPTLIVFVVVNAVDMAVIFPIFVAKLVNLSPLILLAAVAVGQQFYGLVGMLIAVPIASAFKIIYQELLDLLYHGPDSK